jgi:hypothetical protein
MLEYAHYKNIMADYGPRDDAETTQFIFWDNQKEIRDKAIMLRPDVLAPVEIVGQPKSNCEYVLGTKQTVAQIVRCGKPGKVYNNQHLSIPMCLCVKHLRRMAIMLQRRDDICNIKVKCNRAYTTNENLKIMRQYHECSKAETTLTVGQQGGRVTLNSTLPSRETRENLDTCLVNL